MSSLSYKTISIYLYIAYASTDVGYIQCILFAVIFIRPKFSIETTVTIWGNGNLIKTLIMTEKRFQNMPY